MRGRVRLPWRCLPVLFGAFVATGCGGPTKPSTLGPVLVCPGPVTVTSFDGNASPVIYEPASLIAGEPPITTACSPESGSIFQVGTSTVTCTATDAVLRTASCSFAVTVARAATLAVTRFMAFGNSITEGKTASGLILSNNYPENLRGLLAARYASQTISMANKGLGGEYAVDGVDRLPHELDVVHPDALLIEEGINDLGGGDPSSIPPMVDALRSMVREAQGRGISVFVATLTPVRAGSGSKGDRAFPLLPEANDRIRILAQSEHATLVDLYEGLGASPEPYIGTDGLHPNEAGYQKIAQIFFDAIRATLEGPQVVSPVFVRNGAAPRLPGLRLR